MHSYYLFCWLGLASVLLSLLNSNTREWQNTIAITAFSLIFSLALALMGYFSLLPNQASTIEMVKSFNIQDLILKGMLGPMLFAGALGINLQHLKQQRWEIFSLAMVGTCISTVLIGVLLWQIAPLFGLQLKLTYALLFGALISPTDPIAVLAIIKKLKAPEALSTQVEGESLFNDGIGLVIFISLFTLAFGDQAPTIPEVTLLFFREVFGGISYGLVLALTLHWLIRRTDDSVMVLLLTLLVPTAGYAGAEVIHVSGPLAMVVSAIYLGNITQEKLLSAEVSVTLHGFWHMVEEFLNGILFLLIGLLLVTLPFHGIDLLMMILAIPLVLACRWFSVKTVLLPFQFFKHYNPLSQKILTWGGLRGGLALAMAMSIPSREIPFHDSTIDLSEMLMVMTYAVVLFSSNYSPLSHQFSPLMPSV